MQNGICRNFNGVGRTNEPNKKCDAGVCYRSLIGGSDFGWVIRTPCMKEHKTDIVCDKYQEPTREEVEEYEKEIEKHTSQLMLTLPLTSQMKKEHTGKLGRGESAQKIVECPVCHGNLTMSISGYNFHVHGNCETDGCLSWME